MNPFRFASLLLLVVLAGPAFGGAPVGFRTDGTGRYPDAQPPRSWGPDKNVVWKVPLTQSNAIPIIVGDKLFTCAEPCVLICLNKADGKVLWRHESFFNEIQPGEKEKAQIQIEEKQDAELVAQHSALDKEIAALRKLTKDDKATKEETDQKTKELQKRMEELRAKRRELTTLNRFREPGKRGSTWGYHPTGGYTAATPVTDGKNIYVTYGNGLAAAYDIEGKRLWLKFVEQSTNAFGHSTSPILMQDKLVVHFADLVALNTKDGSEVWRTKIAPDYGTAMPSRIGGVDVLFHPKGFVVRADDGAILSKGVGSCGPNSPIVQDGKIFFAAGQARGYTLPATIELGQKWEPLWKGRGANLKGGGSWYPSPILHEDLLYALNSSAAFSVVDVKNGQKVYEEKLELGTGTCYPSLAMAGNYLFASSDNGQTIVLEPGREFKEVARNKLETFRSSPVFEGKRMYVRTVKGLYCIEE